MEQQNYSPWNLFEVSKERYGDRLFLIHGNGQLTYRQVDQKINEVSVILAQWDFKMAGIYLPNCFEFITGLLAFNKLKKVIVPLSYQLKGEMLADLIHFADIELLITDIHGFGEISAFSPNPGVKVILVLQDSGNFEVHRLETEPQISGNPFPGIQDDTFGICFTSGSTSKPKGIILSNYAIAGNAMAVADFLQFQPEDRTLIPRSFAQASPISGDILMAMSRGAGIVIQNDLFHPGIFLKTVQDCQVTSVFMINTMLLQVLAYPQLHQFDISSLKRILLGGMINPRSIFREARQKMPKVSFLNAYGISEASARVAFSSPEDAVNFPGCIRKPIQGCALKIYREDGSEAEPGEKGEIYVSSDYIMDGYYKAPELTAAAITPLGLRTRDIGYQDQDGLYYVVGRSDDLIIQGGNKVYPIEIEEALLKNPAIREAVVLGIEDPKLGQKIVALVTTRPPLEPADVYKWLRSKLEDKKVPKEIHIVDQIPRNPIGKISRTDLKVYYGSLKKAEASEAAS
jgi:long-chain acyl-CoA synthetase